MQNKKEMLCSEGYLELNRISIIEFSTLTGWMIFGVCLANFWILGAILVGY